MRRTVFSEDQLNNIYDLYYNQKKSFQYIQDMYNTSETVLRRIFKEHNWQPRKTYEHFIKYSVNETYFDNIDSPEKAYCIGFLMADGYNNAKTGEIVIKLQERDYSVLEIFNQLVNNTRPLLYISKDKVHNGSQGAVELRIRNKHMSNQLSSLGIVPNKSLILDFPYWITKDLFPFLLQGYIDGDGWIQLYRIGFMSSDKFCYGVQKYLLDNYTIESHVMDMKRHYKEQTKTLYICNRKNIYPLINMMLVNNTIYIPRKREKYFEYFSNGIDINNSLVA